MTPDDPTQHGEFDVHADRVARGVCPYCGHAWHLHRQPDEPKRQGCFYSRDWFHVCGCDEPRPLLYAPSNKDVIAEMGRYAPNGDTWDNYDENDPSANG